MNDLSSAQWRKSSYSGNSGNCVEIRAGRADSVWVRDSKQVPGPVLTVHGDQWGAFVRGVKRGQFNLT
jgi:hypothetical protein